MAVRNYHKAKYDGRIGIALNLSPCIDNDNPNSATESYVTISITTGFWMLFIREIP
jgi:hypothetical protein